MLLNDFLVLLRPFCRRNSSSRSFAILYIFLCEYSECLDFGSEFESSVLRPMRKEKKNNSLKLFLNVLCIKRTKPTVAPYCLCCFMRCLCVCFEPCHRERARGSDEKACAFCVEVHANLNNNGAIAIFVWNFNVSYIYTHCYFVVKKQFFCGINGRIMFSIRLDDSRARKMHTNGKKTQRKNGSERQR